MQLFRRSGMIFGFLFTGFVGFSTFSWAADSAAKSADKPKIMVVDFELRDVSALPDAPQEIERTAFLDSVIRKTLTEHGYQLLAPCTELLEASKQAISYLFDRPALAVSIGGACGADYVLLGQTWKPSYLFVFPRLKLLDTRENLKPEQMLVLLKTVQLEASTLDKNVTESAGRKLAAQVIEKLAETK